MSRAQPLMSRSAMNLSSPIRRSGVGVAAVLALLAGCASGPARAPADAQPGIPAVLPLGSLPDSGQPGTLADVCIWDWAHTPLALRRQAVARELHERLFAWPTLGDEGDLVETWVAGVRQYRRN